MEQIEKHYFDQTVKYRGQIAELKDYLETNWDNLDGEEIANIFGIETTKTIEMTVIIKGTISVKVPMNYDKDDLASISTDIEIDFNDSDVETEDSELEITDIRF
jgi:DNA-directed RNA polymerase sigma subunit (sigma70/sigma32)